MSSKLLVKFPTRSRPEQFLKTLKEYYDSAKDNSNITYLVSYDSDDFSMNESVLNRARQIAPGIRLEKGNSKSKIEACNADIEKVDKWDIVVLISDDMHVHVRGWDEVIRTKFLVHYPDFDGCLWFNDGYQNRICTLSIIGRKYYDRFKYMYHPAYKSLWCDNEFTDVATKLGKITYIQNSIVKHMHPCWGKLMPMDDLYRKNEAFYNEDAQTYNKRKAKNFDLV